MNLELPEYVLLAIAVVLGIGIRHWWKSRRKPAADREMQSGRDRQRSM